MKVRLTKMDEHPWNKTDRYFCEVEIDSDEPMMDLIDYVDYVILDDKSWYVGDKSDTTMTLVCVETLTLLEVEESIERFRRLIQNRNKGD